MVEIKNNEGFWLEKYDRKFFLKKSFFLINFLSFWFFTFFAIFENVENIRISYNVFLIESLFFGKDHIWFVRKTKFVYVKKLEHFVLRFCVWFPKMCKYHEFAIAFELNHQLWQKKSDQIWFPKENVWVRNAIRTCLFVLAKVVRLRATCWTHKACPISESDYLSNTKTLSNLSAISS